MDVICLNTAPLVIALLMSHNLKTVRIALNLLFIWTWNLKLVSTAFSDIDSPFNIQLSTTDLITVQKPIKNIRSPPIILSLNSWCQIVLAIYKLPDRNPYKIIAKSAIVEVNTANYCGCPYLVNATQKNPNHFLQLLQTNLLPETRTTLSHNDLNQHSYPTNNPK